MGESGLHLIGVASSEGGRGIAYLVDVEHLEASIETHVEVVQHVDDLHGRGLGRYRGETHDIAKVDRYAIELLGLYLFTTLQLLSDRAGVGGA